MSDRLWVGPGPAPWADVSLCDYPDIRSALQAFVTYQPLKVTGPRDALVATWEAWAALATEDGWELPGPEEARWYVAETPDRAPVVEVDDPRTPEKP